MQIQKAKFERVVEEAKAKTAGNKRWINAIEKAADAITNGKWVITELQHCIAVTTESGKTYYANNKHCQCEAFFKAFPCKHIAGHRLIELYNEAVDTHTASRTDVIASIKAAWSANFPSDNLADELMRRFRVNDLRFLADDMLAGVLAAIA